MSPLLLLFILLSCIPKISLLYPSAPPQNLYISPSLLPSPYYCSHHLLLILHSPAGQNTRTGRHVHSCISHSHLTFLTLLFLTSEDSSPNPGPPVFHPHTRHPLSSGNSRNPLNLTSVPVLPKTTLAFSCVLWNARSVCNKLKETWLQAADSASPAALSYGVLIWTHSPKPSGRKGDGVGFLLSPLSTFQVLPNPPSLSFSSFETHCIRLFSPISLRIAVIYWPPGPVSRFLDDFSTWLPYFLSSELPTIILG
ncbi:unnamed protein product, partial [Staurois parvus]